MHNKLNLKISGVISSNDPKIIESNLNSLDGVKEARLAMIDKHLEIRLEFEDKKISKQQIFDVIRISGDFNVEEQKINPETILK